jgi:hypothetical protein
VARPCPCAAVWVRCRNGLVYRSPPPMRSLLSSVGPFGNACAPLNASEHVKQRTLGQEPTGRQSILTSHFVRRLTTKTTDSCTRAKQSDGLLDSDTLTGQYNQTRVQRRERRSPPEVKNNENVRPANNTNLRIAWNWSSKSKAKGKDARSSLCALSEPARFS